LIIKIKNKETSERIFFIQHSKVDTNLKHFDIYLFGVRLFSGIFGKKRLYTRGFAWEFLRSGMLYRPGKVSKDVASLLVCTRKNIFCLGGAVFL